ncbi:MAG TPA: hypothetical protein VMS25_01975 [Candidatus Limnocylindrales bacterium]|nr:hypothetical protein [Candidatus Limnocylindrales bacterium]
MAKNKSHEDEIKAGLAALRNFGVAVDAPAPDLVPQLKTQFGKGRETDLAAIFSLGKIFDPAAVEALGEIDRQTTDKDLKKEIKRSRFKLAQKGLVAPQEKAPDTKPAAIFERVSDVEASMSAVDGGGGRLIWITKPQPNHGLQVIQAMLHDREGLLRFGGMHVRRKELRKMADEIKQQHGISMISIPWEFADQIVYEGYERAKARGQSGLENFHEVRSIIATGKPKEQAHPIYRRLDVDQAREGAWRELSRRLLDEPELRYWILTDDWLQAILPQLEEAQTSRLVLNPLQKEERFNAIVREAVKTLCAGENGQAFKRRMEDMALYFLETNRADAARLALAVALQVGEADPGLLDISFLTGLVQKSFAFFMSQEKAKREEEQSSLIIKP